MRSIKYHILILLLLGSLIILGTSSLVGLGFYIKDRNVDSAVIKVQADLAICGEIIETKYPGSWSVRDGDLYKGPIKISFNNDLVDHLSRLTGDTVAIFLGETQVATTVYDSNGERAIGTKLSANVAQKVLKEGQTYVGEAEIGGQKYQTGYVPLRTENDKIIGIFCVGISDTYAQGFSTRSSVTMATLGLALTILVALLAWFLIQRIIIYPLQNIIIETRNIVTGHLTQKIEVSNSKELVEMKDAFNQMVEQIRTLTLDIKRAKNNKLENVPTKSGINTVLEKIKGNEAITSLTGDNTVEAEPKSLSILDTPWCSGEEGLPKGLNKATLSQIVQFLQATRRPISVEEVAEGVKMTRVTVRRYLEFLEQRGVLKSEQKYGTVGRPVKLFIPL